MSLQSNGSSSSSSASDWRLFMCAAGICLSYLYYGMLQEELFSNAKHAQGDDLRVGASFLLLTQCVTNTGVALLWQTVQGSISLTKNSKTMTNSTVRNRRRQKHLHHSLLFMTAFCYFCAMQGSNEALRYVTYPTAVLAKSSKLIPTMAMACLVEGKLYSVREWLAAASITSGVLLFNLSKQATTTMTDKEENSMYGIILLCASLVMDGMLGACQGLLKKQTMPPTATETMLYVNLYASLLLLPLSIYTHEWKHGWEILLASPTSTRTIGDYDSSNVDANDSIVLYSQQRQVQHDVLWLNATAAVGQVFIFLTITWYSSLVCTTITTTRKFFTILLSVVYFGHVFSAVQWLSVLLVFCGLYGGILLAAASSSSNNNKGQAAAAATAVRTNGHERIETTRDDDGKKE